MGLYKNSSFILSYEIVNDINKMPGAKWFKDAKLNFSENLLRYRDDKSNNF